MGCWSGGKRKGKERKEWGRQHRGDVRKFFVVCFCQSDSETTSDRDEISDGDSLQHGEHFYEVGFSIPLLDFSVQVGVCFS